MQISVKYTDFDRNIKESEIEFDNGITQIMNVVITEVVPEEPDMGDSINPLEGTENEEVEVVKTLGFLHYDGVNEIKTEMTYREVMEYISLLTKISKQIR